MFDFGTKQRKSFGFPPNEFPGTDIYRKKDGTKNAPDDVSRPGHFAFSKKNGPLFAGSAGKLRVREFFVELVDTASRVNEGHFAGEKWVRERRNLHFHERIFFAIGPDHGFAAFGAGFTQKRLVGRNVLENDGAVIFWMDVLFHD